MARTAACEFRSVDNDDDRTQAPAALDHYQTPSGVPANAIAFTSPDGFGGREYILGPSNGTCVALSGMDQDFQQKITLPGQHAPAFEQVFGAGGDYQLPYGCRYLPSIRRFAYSPRDCAAAPRTEHIEQVKTGMPTLPAALVRVDPNVPDRQLKTAVADPVLAVVLGFVLDGDADDPAHRPVATSFADCRLTTATADICVASLQLFVDEAIAFQREAVDFPITGHPGAKIRQAIAQRAIPARYSGLRPGRD